MENVKKGKRLFLAMTIIFILLDFAVILFSSDILGGRAFITGIIRMTIELFLLDFIYHGSKIARVILLIFLVLGIILGLNIIVASKDSIVNLFGLCMIALYFWMIYVLTGSPSFKAYLNSLKNN